MPTIRGVLRRGMTVPALREFILQQGPSRNILNLEWGAFWTLNRKYIDPEAPRHVAIVRENVVHCQVHGIDNPESAIKPKFAKNTGLGSKKIMYDKTIVLEQADARTFEEDEKITLMDWGNDFVRKITRDRTSKDIVAMDLELHSDDDFKKTKKITWLAATSSNMIPIDLVSFDYLITKDKLEKEDKLEDFLTPNTEFRSHAFADCNVQELQAGAIVQFERKGYFRLDAILHGSESIMTFFNVPTGKL